MPTAVSGVETCVAIPVAYGGEDLPMVAQALRASVEDVIRAHQEQRWTVAMMGFAPGFGYLVPIGDPLLDWTALARRDRPRERVASGSVAVAVGMSAVYPADMPGGWHLIGRTSLRLFDPADDATPSVLRPGAEVRFRGDTA